MAAEPVRIWVDGCFDLFHCGHANAIRQARQFGTHLIVGCHSDEAIEHNKGPTVQSQEERVKLLSACRWVDAVVPDAPYVTEVDFVRSYGVNYVVHGDDVTTDAEGNDTYRLVKAAGIYKECRRTQGVSTTDVIARILARPAIGVSGPSPPPSAERGREDDAIDAALLQAFAQDPRWPGGASVAPLPAPGCGAGTLVTSHPLEPSRELIYVFGAFDTFAAEEVDFLERLARPADGSRHSVVVGVLSSRASSGSPPILSLRERALGVLQCKYVDGIVVPALLPPNLPPDAFPSHAHVRSLEYAPSPRIADRIVSRRADFEARQRRKAEKSSCEAKLETVS